MQPLYSVDHETRQNSNRVEDQSPVPQEDTPLLHRFPATEHAERSTFMTVSVSLLIIILVTGVIIGIYLLVLQNNAENVLPPVETPLQLISRKQWNHIVTRPQISMNKTKQLIAVQTDTRQCLDEPSCDELLMKMKTGRLVNKTLPYNFLVSSSGRTYEALGWNRPSLLFPQYPNSLVLAFIGNFTEISPPKVQMDEAEKFLSKAVSDQHLDSDYVISGKSTIHEPTSLFKALRTLPQWKGQLID